MIEDSEDSRKAAEAFSRHETPIKTGAVMLVAGGRQQGKSIFERILRARVVTLDGKEKAAREITFRDIELAHTVIVDGVVVKKRFP